MESHSMSTIAVNLFAILFLVFLNGFFVAAEFALVKIRSSRITQLVSEGLHRATYAQKVSSNIDSYLPATQLGITLASLGLGSLGEPYLERLFFPIFKEFGMPSFALSSVSIAVAFSIITILHIVLGELAPKSLAIQKTETLALWLAPPLIFFYKITYPAIWILNKLSSSVLNFLGLKHSKKSEQAHTEEEIRILVTESEKNGIIDRNEKVLFDNVFEFSDRVARETMIPRTSIVVLYAEDSFEENLKVVYETRHTRYPVAEGDKDTIIGFVHVTDLFSVVCKGEDNDLKKVLRKILTVPEFTELSQVLHLMKKNKTQIAVVADEYGGTAGILTLEDILEEIVGEIEDEFDNSRPEYEETDFGYSIDGKMLIQDVNNLLDVDISNDDVDTIGGWVHMKIEDELELGKKAFFDFITFEITEIEKNHILRLNLTLKNKDLPPLETPQ